MLGVIAPPALEYDHRSPARSFQNKTNLMRLISVLSTISRRLESIRRTALQILFAGLCAERMDKSQRPSDVHFQLNQNDLRRQLFRHARCNSAGEGDEVQLRQRLPPLCFVPPANRFDTTLNSLPRRQMVINSSGLTA